MPDVICIGELLVDFVANEENIGLADVSSFTCAAGGAPANVAVAVQRLRSLSAGFVGKVGNDPLGVKLRNTLQSAGVNTTALFVDEHEPTTIVFDSVWSDGHKDMCFYRGADKCLLPEDIQEEMFEDAQCLHCGSITCIEEPGASAQRKALLLARGKGMMISYDPNYRPTLWPDETTAHSKIFDGFKYAHMVKISEEEFNMATGHENIENGIRAVIDQGADLVVVSRGERGAVASNGDYVVESPALKNIEIVETTGAGDGFLAALISRLLPEFKKHGGSLKTLDKGLVKDALDFGNIVGGLTCSKPGAIPSLPSKEEIDEFMEKRKDTIASNNTLSITPQRLAKMIDHSFLKKWRNRKAL